MTHDKRILSLALEALYLERQKIDQEIAIIEQRLGKTRDAQGPSRTGISRISPSGRKAISEAMKKRWAERRLLKTRQTRRR